VVEQLPDVANIDAERSDWSARFAEIGHRTAVARRAAAGT